MNLDEKLRIFKAGWNAALDRDKRSLPSDEILDSDDGLAEALDEFSKDENKNPKGWDHIEKALARVEWPIPTGRRPP